MKNRPHQLDAGIEVVIVCAYHQEARTTIAALGLQRLAQLHPFPVFANERIALIESGQGQTNASCAVGYIAGLLQASRLGWLNLGIAGHRTHAIGQLFVANRIDNDRGERSVFPDAGFFAHWQTATLRSYTHVNDNYPDNALCDMEAWGFFNAATKFDETELIHCVKIVSDNQSAPASELQNKQARDHIPRLFEHQHDNILKLIDSLAARVREQRQQQEVPAAYGNLTERYHFNENQRRQLLRLIRNWQHLSTTPIENLLADEIFDNSRALLAHLEDAYQRLCDDCFRA